jgi:membrane-bound lytic murein transglycosylase B
MKKLILFFCLVGGLCFAKSQRLWLSELKQEALSEGISADVFEQMLANWKPRVTVVKLDRNQPEKRLTFEKYRRTRANKSRVVYGHRAWKKHGRLISDVAKEYSVDPCIVAAIWGIETSYGNYMGKFPVIESLATLAYDGRRAEFFRKELLLALHIVNDGHVSPYRFVGEWAGGSGHPQFLPSSWVEYAKDHDQDGRKDIWTNLGDVFASISNYIHKNGWQLNQPIAVLVKSNKAIDNSWLGFSNSHALSFWKKVGISSIKGSPLPYSKDKLALIQLEGGPLVLAYPNFKVLMRYNYSVYYAGTVTYLADKICKRGGVF